MRLVYLRNVVSLALDSSRCVGCGTCVEVCPHPVLELVNGRSLIADRDSCMECGACATNCATGAITVEAGVGCATAVINSALGRTGSSCCCTVERDRPGGGCC